MQFVFKPCTNSIEENWLNCGMACIPKKFLYMLETTEFWYCDNWKQVDFCECDYCIFLKKVCERVGKIYSIECVKLPVFILNLDAFFKFICFYNDRDWFQNFLYFFCAMLMSVFFVLEKMFATPVQIYSKWLNENLICCKKCKCALTHQNPNWGTSTQYWVVKDPRVPLHEHGLNGDRHTWGNCTNKFCSNF